MTEIQGKSILVRVSESSSYRESTVQTAMFPVLSVTSKFARKAQRVGGKQVPLLSLLTSVVPCQWSLVNRFSCSSSVDFPKF